MNQIDTIKALLVKYTEQCGPSEMNDAAKAAAYVEAHKPPGVGRVSTVIIQPILGEVRQLHWDKVFHRVPEPEPAPAPTPSPVVAPAPAPIPGIQFEDDDVAVAPDPAPPKPSFWKRVFGS